MIATVRTIAAALLLTLASATMAGAMLAAGAIVSSQSAAASELVMFDSKSCGVCAQFNREVAPGYERSAAARVFPLRHIDIHSGNVDFALKIPPSMTPTFVFVDNGAEIGRFVGYPGKEYFYKIVNSAAEAMLKLKASQGLGLGQTALPQPQIN